MKHLCKNKNWKLDEDYDTNKVLYLLIDRPNNIDYWNDFVWNDNKGYLHRNYDLPTVVYNNDIADIVWYKNDQIHRNDNKPALILANGKKECWIYGKYIKEAK